MELPEPINSRGYVPLPYETARRIAVMAAVNGSVVQVGTRVVGALLDRIDSLEAHASTLALQRDSLQRAHTLRGQAGRRSASPWPRS